MPSVVAAPAGWPATPLGRVTEPVRLERVALPYSLSPLEVVRAVRREPGAFALTGSWAGGGAIVGCGPLAQAPVDADPFDVVSSVPGLRRSDDIPASAVGGGWFGWFGYRLGRRIERLPEGPPRPVELPEFSLAYYDHVLRLDPDGRWWFESLVTETRRLELERRRDHLDGMLATAAHARSAAPGAQSPYIPPPPLRLTAAAAERHLEAVRECRERIAAGEIYQANICLRLETEWDGDVAALFERARQRIDPPYAAMFCTAWGGLASLSPELFLRRRGSEVTTAPIKGTISRDPEPERALQALSELRGSAKDAAEHVMIVDLMRNDIGRVCEYGSVVAPRTPDAEAHPGLWHLVSRVRGTVRREASDGDLLRATFPPGSVTGAPKVQAMRVIAALESTGREAYTGAIGYVSPVAGVELSVAIRTLELCRGHLWLGAGGGIVADSDPRRELEEALIKARPIAAAIGSSVYAEHDDRHRPDPALGVFETLLIRDGQVQALERHLQRLTSSVAELYGQRLPDDLGDRIRAHTAAAIGEHRLRVRAVPGGGGLAAEIESERLALPEQDAKLTLKPLLVPGGLGAHKWSDRRLLDRHGEPGSVPLIVDRDDEVLEAAWANVWIVEGRRIVTPPADGRLLPGVTRELLLELAPALGLSPAIEPITLARARGCDAIFLTSSLRHAVGATLGDAPVDGDYSVVSMIREALSEA